MDYVDEYNNDDEDYLSQTVPIFCCQKSRSEICNDRVSQPITRDCKTPSQLSSLTAKQFATPQTVPRIPLRAASSSSLWFSFKPFVDSMA